MKDSNYFDIIVIGAGSGGLNVSSFMAKAGFGVLLIDRQEQAIGGDCLNFGCVPSKALIHVAREIYAARSAGRFGLSVSGTTDIVKVTGYIKEKQTIIRQDENSEALGKKGITVKLGEAKFADPDSITLNGEIYRSKKIVLAAGSRPRRLLIPGIERVKNIFSNENIFDISFLPQHLVVIGNGPIGLEIGQAFFYLGSQVTIISRGDGILDKEDPEMSDLLMKHLKELGMGFELNVEPIRFEGEDSLILRDSEKKEKPVKFDAVLVAIGRELNTGGLDLERAGVKLNGSRLEIDKYLRTTNKNILAIGDIAGLHQFTHAAELHASVILKNLFSPVRKPLNSDRMNWVTFTDPELATFGLSEKEIINRGMQYSVIKRNFATEDRAIIDEATGGLLKIFISKSGEILGGSMLAKNAGEMVQELILAQSAGLKLNALFKKIYPYPVASRVNRKAASEFMAGQLTNLAKKLLRILYH